MLMRLKVIILYLLVSGIAFTQTKTISGVLKNSSGEPMPGASILIKGTTTGTVSDLDGKYSITAPIGSTIQISMIGMITEEFVVTDDYSSSVIEENFYPQRNKPLFKVSYPQDTCTKNTGAISFNNAKRVTSSAADNIYRIKDIKNTRKGYLVKTFNQSRPMRKEYGIQYSYMFGLSAHSQIPEKQTSYSQGRSVEGQLSWLGAENSEIFSWGPKLSNLEFDGSNYNYDVNGRLVAKGLGNGTNAKAYNTDVFQTGIFQKHDLFVTLSPNYHSNIVTGLSTQTTTGIIPNTDKKDISFHLRGERLEIARNSNISFQTIFYKSDGYLLNHGANISRILGEAFLTPISFDNSNNQNPGDAIASNKSYLFPDGSNRSYAINLANNPYGLIATSPDNDDYMHFNAGIEHKQEINFGINDFNISTRLSSDRQWLETAYGIPTGYVGNEIGILTKRKNESENYSLNFTPTLTTHFDYDFECKLILDCYLNYENQLLAREDRAGLSTDGIPGSTNYTPAIGLNIHRLSNKITPQLNMRLNYNHSLTLGNTFYYSSRVAKNSYRNFSPYVGLHSRINLSGFELSPNISYSRSVQEASLIYNDWAYTSVNLSLADFRSVYENTELIPVSLNPETESKIEGGIESRMWYGRVYLKFYYTYKLTENFVAPISVNNDFELQNIADITNNIFKVNANFNSFFFQTHWRMHINWIAERPVVKKVYSSSKSIPLAGFSNSFKSLTEGEALGTIQGTYYERNENGKLIIGSDGFPIASNTTKALANPNPDWIMGISNNFFWHGFDLNFVFEWYQGGKIWNGTAAYLDYVGQSKKTEEQRSITDYIYEGVNEMGEENTIPVDFYNDELPVSQNRWVRYGAEGVTEEYIENATSFRLRELAMSYRIRPERHWHINEVRISLLGRNLFQITPYSGVDPQSPLFGYNLGQGLDLFNTPSVKSYMIKVLLKI